MMILSLVLFVMAFLVLGIVLDRKYSREQPDESKVCTPATLTYNAAQTPRIVCISRKNLSIKEFGIYMRANKKKNK